MRRKRMAETNLAKKANGYNYKYTELSQINEYVESIGGSYYQYIDSTESGVDYIVTVKIDKDGKESKPLRGCRIIDTKTLQGKSNPAQEMGSGITYARRYSLLMAYGLAPEDDDAETLTTSRQPNKSRTVNNPTPADIQNIAAEVAQNIAAPEMISDALIGQIQYLAKEKSILPSEICQRYKVSSLKDLTMAQGTDALRCLEKSKARV